MVRIVLVVLVLAALVALAWPHLAPAVESAIETVKTTSEPEGLPGDWEHRYDQVVASLRDRARGLFARQVEVRADRIEAARSVLLGWEEELLEGERAVLPLEQQTQSLDAAERSLASARRQLAARADQLERERSVRRAKLDAAAARRELRAVREVESALDDDPSLEELHRIVGLVDRELVVAEARESLEDAAGDAESADTLARAASRMEERRRRAVVEARVERRLRGELP